MVRDKGMHRMVPLSYAWAMSWVMSKVPQLLCLGRAGLVLGVQEMHSFTWSRLLAVAARWVPLRGS